MHFTFLEKNAIELLLFAVVINISSLDVDRQKLFLKYKIL
jgi:hypothetical protein